jgi:uncharacterized membrane protein YgcG
LGTALVIGLFVIALVLLLAIARGRHAGKGGALWPDGGSADSSGSAFDAGGYDVGGGGGGGDG